ncbi:BQ5605_C039g11758 [Microbotryum silenes-dioicae]|uniref:BQ5605_C039g11758 protein n=1 Tax=Microbotryum silenes-dioicae TaxID=796604 RepID=A0A2X0MEQ8_9BASI|nr:BQ5605_C039g11758 [Microbotryum silenes-dioicae]
MATSTATPPPILSLGTRVVVSAGIGTLRFVGPTNFAAGKWCGIELDDATGKNDGSVNGQSYFTCRLGKGVFVRHSQVRLLVGGDDERGSEAKAESPTPIQRGTRTGSSVSARTSGNAAAGSASSSRPPSRPTRPGSSTEKRPLPGQRAPSLSISTATARAGVSSVAVSGRTSVASNASDRVTASPSKLARPGGGVRLAPTTTSATGSRSVSATSASSSGSAAATTTTTNRPGVPGATRRQPSVSSTGTTPTLMGPPPTPAQRAALARPPQSAAAASRTAMTSPVQNFAPSSIGTPRTLTRPTVGTAPSARGMSRSSSSSSIASSSSALPHARRASMVVSPTASRFNTSALMLGGNATASSEMARHLSGTSPVDAGMDWDGEGESLLLEEEEATNPRGPGATSHPGERRTSGVGPSTEARDPFSLQQPDARRTMLESVVPKREHDELLAKLRILEARRAEDREKLRDVERLKEEAEEWDKIKEKTRTKLVELANEVKELKKANKELRADRDAFESKFEDLNDQVEISLLDKEVAEERFDAVNAQLEAVKERAAELEVEVAVLREENSKLEGEGAEAVRQVEGGDATKTSLAYIQLEKQNLRLKDALLRLRDLTSETEAEQKRKIADLEAELDLTSDLQAEFENNLIELERAEAQVEELKIQLDDTLGAEDMLEQLTDKNLLLTEKIDELTTIVEDLESLKELNDELEESHVETEKQMQEELDLKDLQLQELRQRTDVLEDGILDYERTISQFRELVANLQSDLEQLRHHQASQQSESASLTSQSQAMLNLNLKLQSSMLKGQVKTIDLELRKLDAQQASEHLAIVRPYLLPAFFDNDSDAVDALLFFERIAYKADLVGMLIEQTHGVTEALNSVVPEALIAVCETRAKLAQFATLNKKFSANLKRCDPETFLKMGRIYHEVSPTEKRVDAFIDALRREELREVECGKEVDGLIAQAEHLAETHLTNSVLDLAERELACVTALDLHFDTIAAAVGFAKQTIATLSKDPDVALELGDANIDDIVFKPLQNLFNQARNAKVVTKKLLRRLEELVGSSSALSMDHAEGVDTLSYNSSAIAAAAAKLASSILAYCTEVRTSKRPFELSHFLAIAKDVAANELGKQTARPLEEIGALLGQLAQDVGTTLSTAMDPDQIVRLDYEPPWIARVTELQSHAAINVEAERKVHKLNEELRDLVREMRTKDMAYQESIVKIEVMEKRMEAVKKQADAITELEAELVKSKKQERVYEEAIEALHSDLDAMEQELTKMKQNVVSNDKSAGPGEGEAVVYEGNMETSYLIEQLESLRNAVRFLRSENSYLKSQDLLTELDALPTYVLPAITPIMLPKETSGLPVSPRRTPVASATSTTVAPLEPTSFAVQSKQLLHEARLLSATPRLVDLSGVRPGGKKGWTPSARLPSSQLRAEKDRSKALSRKVEALWEMRPRVLAVL